MFAKREECLVLVHGPDFRGVIVRARREKVTGGIPLDAVDFVRVPFELFQRCLLANFADVNLLIHTGCRKNVRVSFPIDVQTRRFV